MRQVQEAVELERKTLFGESANNQPKKKCQVSSTARHPF